jgi:hypothetical protein
MLVRTVFKVKLSVAGGIGAVIVNWLAEGETSPLYHYFLWHVAIPNIWGRLNIIPAIVSALIAGNPHSGSEVVYSFGVFIQWFLIVYLLCGLIPKARVPES